MNEEFPATILLQNAARLVERAIQKLNTQETQCGECGGRHFANRVHARIYERLTDTPDRLRRAAIYLATGQEPDAKQVVDATTEMLGLSARRR